jgi:hypothetical protein
MTNSPPPRNSPPKHKSPPKRVHVKVDRLGRATITVKQKKPKGATFEFPDSSVTYRPGMSNKLSNSFGNPISTFKAKKKRKRPARSA